jgi:hypothetical protein
LDLERAKDAFKTAFGIRLVATFGQQEMADLKLLFKLRHRVVHVSTIDRHRDIVESAPGLSVVQPQRLDRRFGPSNLGVGEGRDSQFLKIGTSHLVDCQNDCHEGRIEADFLRL